MIKIGWVSPLMSWKFLCQEWLTSLTKNLVVRQANQESAYHFNIISSYIESSTKLLPLKELQARKY